MKSGEVSPKAVNNITYFYFSFISSTGHCAMYHKVSNFEFMNEIL